MTSLPGRVGIGDLGDAAYRFVDFLAESGQQYWQIMPLGPTSYGDSPYQALSAFAGNPLLISLERLVEEGVLAPWDLDGAPDLRGHGSVDYGAVIEFKQRALRRAHENFKRKATAEAKVELAEFVSANAAWLDDYALFAALKEATRGQAGAVGSALSPRTSRTRSQRWRTDLSGQIEFQQYVQYRVQQSNGRR